MDARSEPDGLTTVVSRQDFATTLARLTDTLKGNGATIFAVVDHAAGAQGVGLALGPTTVVIFGDPRAGTPLMQARQTAGIDLPLKILVWQDDAGAVRLSYNEPAWIARRHRVDPDAQPAVGRMAGALSAVTQAAAGAA
jgi:uncharacterized protein (DUF302 family)